MSRILAGFVLMLSMASVTSAQVATRVWTVGDGLPNNAITDLLQTRDGYLWIATWAGAARFDGVRFTSVAAELPNDHVRVLLEARDGSVWLGIAGGGVAEWRDGVVRTVDVPQGLLGRDVRALAEGPDGRIWAGTESGITVIAPDRVTALGAEHGLPAAGVNALATGRDGTVWIATARGVCGADPRTLHCAAPIFDGPASVVFENAARVLYIGGPDGLLVNGAWRLTGRHVTAILESRSGELWVGFDNGDIAHLDDSGDKFYGAADGLPSAGPVVSLTEDHEGSIWVATYNSGLTRLNATRVKTYSTEDGLPAPVVGSIVQDANGRIWAGSQCGPITELVDGRWEPRFVDATRGACALVLLSASDGALWIGTQGRGLFRWDGTRMQHFDHQSGLSHDYVCGLFEDRDGIIWIGTELGGLHRYEDGNLSRAYGEADGLQTTYLASFAQDASGRIWIGSNANGLSIYEDGAFRSLPPEESPPTTTIAGLFVDSRGDLWVGSVTDGLFRRRNGRFEQFGVAEGLGDSLIAIMLEDRAGALWVHTAKGISRLDRERIDAVADGRAASLEPIILNRGDGLRTVEGSGGGFDPSGLRDRDGRLWFSTVNGIVVIDPATFRTNATAPKVAIEGVMLAGTVGTIGDDGAFAVPAGTAEIEIAYTALSFLSPSRVRFRYRMLGFDDVWHDVGGRRAAYFTALRPGRYTFEVTAANNDGVWAEVPAVVHFDVAPFWWERTSVRLAALVLLMVASGLVVRTVSLRRARARVAELERAQALDRERSRIARDLHDDLGSRLARIVLAAEGGHPGGGVPIAAHARDALKTMDELVWTVNARNDTVESFAHYAAEFAQEQLAAAAIRCRLHIAPDLGAAPLPADTRRHLYLSLKEAIHNVIKHAHASEVSIGLSVDAGALTLTVADDGCGVADGESATGNGLRNMRERMAAAGGTVTMQSRPGEGCRLTFEVRLT